MSQESFAGTPHYLMLSVLRRVLPPYWGDVLASGAGWHLDDCRELKQRPERSWEKRGRWVPGGSLVAEFGPPRTTRTELQYSALQPKVRRWATVYHSSKLFTRLVAERQANSGLSPPERAQIRHQSYHEWHQVRTVRMWILRAVLLFCIID